MSLILGIDPGSRLTGFGFLNAKGKSLPTYVHSGVVRTQASDLPGRLGEIFTQLNQLIQTYRPDEVAIEQVFLAHNAASALKLGQARGAAIVAAVQYGTPIFEYSAKQIKLAAVGYGAADKKQMQLMMRHHLQLQHMPQSDEADALGVAWCHSQARSSPLNTKDENTSAASTALNASWRSRGRRGQALKQWAQQRASTKSTTRATKSAPKPSAKQTDFKEHNE